MAIARISVAEYIWLSFRNVLCKNKVEKMEQ